ncbi:ABC transporter permease [Streptomyces hirsutus]|uniref:ABC transporter permease n=1 Tax=Streptomyces hirsutus TaxID=35620 RepID=UPI0036CDD70B
MQFSAAPGHFAKMRGTAQRPRPGNACVDHLALVGALGWGQEPVLTMAFLLCFFPIVLSTATGLTSTPADLAELARSLDASRWQAFRKVRLSDTLPQIFVGLKVVMPLAAIGAAIGEFQAGKSGLGYLIVQVGGVGNVATAWVSIILIGLMSVLLYFALVLMEWFALPWIGNHHARLTAAGRPCAGPSCEPVLPCVPAL